jgi:hypothetical protein
MVDFTSMKDSIDAGHYDSELPSGANAEERKLRRADERRLKAVFASDLIEAAGVTGHPKAQRCFDLAWEYGHSGGLQDVRYYFEELVELIKE